MDREALAQRNQRMAEAFHATTFKQQLRRAALHTLAHLPIAQNRPTDSQRILLIRPDHLGDVLLTTPAIRALRAALPHAELHALVGAWSAEVLAPYDELDQVLTLPFPGFARAQPASRKSPYLMALDTALKLRRVGYAAAIIFRPDHWWGALAAYLAGIPERVGYVLPDVAPFLTYGVAHQRRHAITQSLRLVEQWTGALAADQIRYSFLVSETDRDTIDAYLGEQGIPVRQPIIAIHPGSGTWVKRWDDARWAVVGDTLAHQLDARVVFTGGAHELSLVQSIAATMQTPASLLVGSASVGQLAALYARARVVLGPDSGPLHLAVAVGTPTVTLFGAADPVEFAPWGSPNRHAVLAADIACRPCRVLDWGNDDPANHPCVRDITVEHVLAAARRVVNS